VDVDPFAAACGASFDGGSGRPRCRPLLLQPRIIARRWRSRRRHRLGWCQRRRAGNDNRQQCQTCPFHSHLPRRHVRSVLDRRQS